MALLYKQKAEAVADTLQRYEKSTDGWSVAKEDKNFIIRYRPSDCEDFTGHLYKGEAVIDAPPKVVFEYVEPLPNGPRPRWDKSMKKIEILRWVEEPHLRINRACTSSAMLGLISPRDFVDLILIKETDEYISTNAISIDYEGCPEVKDHVRGWNWPCGMICCKYPDIEDPQFPEEKKYVRGWNYPCGIIVEKMLDNPNKCRLVSLIQPDIKGMLPKSLVDSAIPGSMTDFFNNLRDALKNDGKMVS